MVENRIPKHSSNHPSQIIYTKILAKGYFTFVESLLNCGMYLCCTCVDERIFCLIVFLGTLKTGALDQGRRRPDGHSTYSQQPHCLPGWDTNIYLFILLFCVKKSYDSGKTSAHCLKFPSTISVSWWEASSRVF